MVRLLEQISIEKFKNLNDSLNIKLKNKLSSLELYDNMYLENILKFILVVDPTYNYDHNEVGKYSLWIKRQIINSNNNVILDFSSTEENENIISSKLSVYNELLLQYNNLILKDESISSIEEKYKNIDYFKSFNELEKFLIDYLGDKSLIQLSKDSEFVLYIPFIKNNELIKIFENKNWYIFVPLTKEQAIQISQVGTNWCIRYKNDTNMFNRLYYRQPLIIIVNKIETNKDGDQIKYQFYYDYSSIVDDPSSMMTQEIDQYNNPVDTYEFLNNEFFSGLDQICNLKLLLKEKIKNPLNDYYQKNIELFNITNLTILQKIIANTEIEEEDMIPFMLSAFYNKTTGEYLKYLPNKWQVLQVQNHQSLIQYIVEPNEDIQLQQVTNGRDIYYLYKNSIIPTLKVLEYQVHQTSEQIKDIICWDEQQIPDSVFEIQINKDPNLIYHIIEQYQYPISETLQTIMVTYDGRIINKLFSKGTITSDNIYDGVIIQQLNSRKNNDFQFRVILSYGIFPSNQVLSKINIDQFEKINFENNKYQIEQIKLPSIYTNYEEVQLDLVKQNILQLNYIDNPYPSVLEFVSSKKIQKEQKKQFYKLLKIK